MKNIEVWRDVTLVVSSRPMFTLETPPPSWSWPRHKTYCLDFLRLSIVIWPHATFFSIETVYAKWRILAYITIILNMDMEMPKRWVSVGCTSKLSFLFLSLTWKFMAVVCLVRAACQWSGQHLRFSMGILQTFPAKVMCMYFLKSNYNFIVFLVKA